MTHRHIIMRSELTATLTFGRHGDSIPENGPDVLWALSTAGLTATPPHSHPPARSGAVLYCGGSSPPLAFLEPLLIVTPLHVVALYCTAGGPVHRWPSWNPSS
eukprot:TRINITY_DN136188_c0_g1_i1.p1 TRINITY_DN136188_c0_g1~~TRINITY_DN136188_c0_g1_i1.p1  ORF type:complete len:103 (+),score=14.44 TRINITY_DN136188_c0_g1_i1:92-400(+)